MDNTHKDDTFCDTGIPSTAMAKSFEEGSPEELFERALKTLDQVVVADIRLIKTIEQAEKAYGKTENRKERDAILIKWMILCKTKKELIDPMILSLRQSLPEAVALQRTIEFKFT